MHFVSPELNETTAAAQILHKKDQKSYQVSISNIKNHYYSMLAVGGG